VARYPLNLPAQLKREAEKWAAQQGVSLNQFIMWAVAEKVGALGQSFDDVRFPHITYRRGAAGLPTPIIRGTGVRVVRRQHARQHGSGHRLVVTGADERKEVLGLPQQCLALLRLYQWAVFH